MTEGPYQIVQRVCVVSIPKAPVDHGLDSRWVSSGRSVTTAVFTAVGPEAGEVHQGLPQEMATPQEVAEVLARAHRILAKKRLLEMPTISKRIH